MTPLKEQTVPDETLAVYALAGDERAFEQLAGRYLGRVYVIGYARLGQREAAEDLTQEVFIRVLLNLERYDPARPFVHWISRIAHNLACDWQRHKRRRSALLTMLPMDDGEMTRELPDPNNQDARESLAARERQSFLEQALGRLPADMREVLLLSYVEGLNDREIAEQLGVHPSTVGRLEKRALDLLKGDLGNILKDSSAELRPSQRLKTRTATTLAALAALSLVSRSALAAGAGALGHLAEEAVWEGGSAAGTGDGLAGKLGGAIKGALASKTVFFSIFGLMLLGGGVWLMNVSGFDPGSLFAKSTRGNGPVPVAVTPAPLPAQLIAQPITPGAPQATQPPVNLVLSAPPAARTAPAQRPEALSPAPAIAPSREAQLQQAARQADVRLTGYAPQPGGALITVSWVGDRADQGGNFLEQAVREETISNFSLDGQLRADMVNGRRVYTARYHVTF